MHYASEEYNTLNTITAECRISILKTLAYKYTPASEKAGKKLLRSHKGKAKIIDTMLNNSRKFSRK